MILHLILRDDESGPAEAVFASADAEERDRVLLELTLSGASGGGAHHYADLIEVGEREIVDGLITAAQDEAALATEWTA